MRELGRRQPGLQILQLPVAAEKHRSVTGDRTEFITLSLWDSVDAIRAFAGDDIDAVVLYPQDARYLVGESTVTHYQVVAQVQPAPGQAREPHDKER